MYSWCSKCKKWFVQQQTLYSMALSVSRILELVATLDVAVKRKDFLYITNEKQCLNITILYSESLQVTHIQRLSH